MTRESYDLAADARGASLSEWNLWCDAAVALFIVATTCIGMQLFPLRMATLHTDDGPIFYAYAFKNPEMFRGDYQVGAPVAERVSFKVGSSAQYWIPALLWKYLNADPYYVTYVLTFAQVALVGVAIYVLGIVLTGSRPVAALTVIFAFLTAPFVWDLANYSTPADWFFTPYPAFSAIVPATLGLCLIVAGRWYSALPLLLLAGWIHPNVALYAVTIAGLYLLPEVFPARDKSAWYRAAALVVVAVGAVTPGLIVNSTLNQVAVDTKSAMAGLRCNQHIWPWGYTYRWTFSIVIMLKWLLFALLSWRYAGSLHRSARRLWLAALVAAVLLGAVHVLAAVLPSPMLLKLIGLRSGLWFALISLPLVVNYWRQHLVAGNWSGAVAAILCFGLPVFASEYALFWPPILVLALVDASEGRLSFARFELPAGTRRAVRVAAFLTLAAWLGLLVVTVVPSPPEPGWSNLIMEVIWGARGGPPGQRVRLLVVASACLAAAILRTIAGRDPRPEEGRALLPRSFAGLSGPAFATALAMVAYGLLFCGLTFAKTLREQGSAKTQAILDLQRWARDESPRDAIFVANVDGWRTQTLRRQFEPVTRESYAYFASQAMLEHRAELLRFYGVSKEQIAHEHGRDLARAQLELFCSFSAADYCRFARAFGATHLVLPASQPNVQSIRADLPAVYENSGWVVFQLDGAARPDPAGFDPAEPRNTRVDR